MNKKKNKALKASMVTAVLMSAVVPSMVVGVETAQAADEIFISGDFKYTVYGNSAMIIGYTGASKDVVIPQTVNGKPVTTIGYGAFDGQYLTSVVIPEGVVTIDAKAFYRHNLIELTLPSTLINIASDSFGYSTYSEDLVRNATLQKVIVLSPYLKYPDNTNKVMPVVVSGLIWGYTGSTTETAYKTKGFAALPANAKQPTVTTNLVSGQSYKGIVNPVFNIKDAENVTYTLNGSSYDGVQAIKNIGENTVVVKATNGVLETKRTYTVNILENKEPQVKGTIDNKEVAPNKVLNVDLSTLFSDTDLDALSYEVETSSSRYNEAWIDGKKLKFVGEAEDTYTLKVRATDGMGYSEYITFDVDVKGVTSVVEAPKEELKEDPKEDPKEEPKLGDSPKLVNGLPNQTVSENQIFRVNIKDLFSDVDTKNLQYIAETSDDVFSTVTVDKEGNLKFVGKYADNYKVNVKAYDGNTYSDSFEFVIDVLGATEKAPTTTIIEKMVNVKELKADNTEIINVSLNKQDGGKSINLSGLLRNINMDGKALEIKSTNEKVADYTYDQVKQVINLEPKENGFTNIQLVANDGTNEVVILFMIDVNDKANASINYIANAQIYLNKEAYVVPLSDVYGTTEDITYTVSVEDKDKKAEEESKELENNETNEDGNTPAEGDGATEETTPTEGDTEPTEVVGETEPQLMALMNFPVSVPMLAEYATTTEYVFEVPKGVTNTVLHEDADILVQLVNGKLVVEGKKEGNYKVSVNATKVDGTQLASVTFELNILEEKGNGTGTGKDTETGSDTETGTGNGTETGTGNGTETGTGNETGNEIGNETGSGAGTDSGTGTEIGNGTGTTGTGTGTNATDGTNGTGTGTNGTGTNATDGTNGTGTGTNGTGTNGTGTNQAEATNKVKELERKLKDVVVEIEEKEDGILINLENEEKIAGGVTLTLTEEGVILTSDGVEVNVGKLLNIKDYTNKRAVRVGTDGLGTVPHYTENKALVITSNNLDNILITNRLAEPFTDVNDTDYFKGNVEDIYNYIITTGTSETTYSPNKDITRGQFAVMIARALELEAKNPVKFKDVKVTWYAKEVQALYEAGLITGYEDGNFGGQDTLTRQQASAIISRMLDKLGVDTTVKEKVHFEDEKSISNYAKEGVHFLATQGILDNGDGVSFNPNNKLTRGQMAKVLIKALRLTEKY